MQVDTNFPKTLQELQQPHVPKEITLRIWRHRVPFQRETPALSEPSPHGGHSQALGLSWGLRRQMHYLNH